MNQEGLKRKELVRIKQKGIKNVKKERGKSKENGIKKG